MVFIVQCRTHYSAGSLSIRTAGGELSLVSRRKSFQNKRLIDDEKHISKFGTSNPSNALYIYIYIYIKMHFEESIKFLLYNKLLRNLLDAFRFQLLKKPILDEMLEFCLLQQP